MRALTVRQPKRIRARCPEHGLTGFEWNEQAHAWLCDGHADCLALVGGEQAAANPDGERHVWQPLHKREGWA